MKTNVSIELSRDELDALASMLDGKNTKRLATRKDITELVNKTVGGLIEDARYVAGKVDLAPPAAASPLYKIHSGEERFLKGKSKSFVYGWNKARTPGFKAENLALI